MSFFTHRSSLQASSLTRERLVSQTDRHLTQEYRAIQALFTVQPASIQFFIKDQAQVLGAALINRKSYPGFSLPHWVVCTVSAEQPTPLPASFCWQKMENWKDRFNHTSLLQILDRHLSDLERESHPAVATGAALLRYATALHLVHGLLPATNLIDSDGDELGRNIDPVIEGESDPGTVLVHNHRMPVQPYVDIFRAASRLAAYITVDEEYRLKHFRLLGRWMDQCRALANYETEMLIQNLRGRIEAAVLNRGLSLSLPYFDDQRLEMQLHDFTVIPAGRIPFSPDLLVAAAREEQHKVAKDLNLSATTRLHLIAELRMIDKAFQNRPKLDH